MAVSEASDYHDVCALNNLFKDRAKQFSVFHLNARSLRNKQDELCRLFQFISFTFDVLLFTETWLCDEKAPSFPNYVYNGLTRSLGRGGGVAIYVQQTIPHAVVAELSFINPDVECLTVNIGICTVVVIYRPPAGNKLHFFEFLEDLFCHLCSNRRSFEIMGDLNINMLVDDAPSLQLTELINSFACTSLITKATRLTGKTATLLDLCISNVHPPDIAAGLLSLDISDHLPIFCLFPVSRKSENKPDELTCRIDEQSLNRFRLLVCNTDWRCILI